MTEKITVSSTAKKKKQTKQTIPGKNFIHFRPNGDNGTQSLPISAKSVQIPYFLTPLIPM